MLHILQTEREKQGGLEHRHVPAVLPVILPDLDQEPSLLTARQLDVNPDDRRSQQQGRDQRSMHERLEESQE